MNAMAIKNLNIEVNKTINLLLGFSNQNNYLITTKNILENQHQPKHKSLHPDFMALSRQQKKQATAKTSPRDNQLCNSAQNNNREFVTCLPANW